MGRVGVNGGLELGSDLGHLWGSDVIFIGSEGQLGGLVGEIDDNKNIKAQSLLYNGVKKQNQGTKIVSIKDIVLIADTFSKSTFS